jgi:guanine nucleotide-binding protein subunit alpha
MLVVLSSFLNDLERIASRSYEPSDDDVVRARLRTLGVQEYKIEFTPDNVNQNILSGMSISFCHSTLSNEALTIGAIGGVEYGREWRIYDVGGSRSMVLFHYSTRIAFVLITI